MSFDFRPFFYFIREKVRSFFFFDQRARFFLRDVNFFIFLLYISCVGFESSFNELSLFLNLAYFVRVAHKYEGVQIRVGLTRDRLSSRCCNEINVTSYVLRKCSGKKNVTNVGGCSFERWREKSCTIITDKSMLCSSRKIFFFLSFFFLFFVHFSSASVMSYAGYQSGLFVRTSTTDDFS